MGEEFHCVLGVKFQAFWEVRKYLSEHSCKAIEAVSSYRLTGPTSPPHNLIITRYLSDFTEWRKGGTEGCWD